MKTTALKRSDAKVITQIVELFSNEGYEAIKMHVLRVFGKDITCDHYIMIGQVIGLKSATENNSREKQKHMNYGTRHSQN